MTATHCPSIVRLLPNTHFVAPNSRQQHKVAVNIKRKSTTKLLNANLLIFLMYFGSKFLKYEKDCCVVLLNYDCP